MCGFNPAGDGSDMPPNRLKDFAGPGGSRKISGPAVSRRVIVIGGGAGGIMAALTAQRQGARALILEKNARIGRKLLATGNGRCNLSNEQMGTRFYHGADPLFASYPLTLMNPSRTRALFGDMGLETKTEPDGRVYPLCDQASAVLDVLLFALEKSGVEVQCGRAVLRIRRERRGLAAECADGGVYRGDRMILACGGKAMPGSGSDGSGFDLALSLGHSVTDVFPALTQLKLEGGFFPALSGVKIEGAAAVLDNGEEVQSARGDLLFADYGISGPPILQLSRKAGEILNRGHDCQLRLRLSEIWGPEDILDRLTRRCEALGDWPVSRCLVGFVNKRLGQVLLKESDLFHRKDRLVRLSETDLRRLARLFWDWRIPVRGLRGWSNAQVTAGGVATGDIDARTMESALVKGLYFAGEIMDIDGDCGGYNLQWAWSSGYAAGLSAAQ
jgi:predicted Rossmann fold flavoprotein